LTSRRLYAGTSARFDHALNLLDRARAAAPDEAHGRIPLKQASIYAMKDEPERALESLQEAGPRVEVHGDRRQLCVCRFNLARCLCDLERFGEAEALLPQVRELAEELGNKLDLVRLQWLEAKVFAGLGRTEEARQAYEEVRQAFADDKIAYDCALVSLELALPLLTEGRTAEVRALAEEMVWIFEAEGVPENALAALTVFCQAAKEETATVELARRVLRFLERAREDPDARF
jgi:tetratricopeptide (TPR) repeat protein